MRATMRRLRANSRRWRAEIALRGLGLGLLAACATIVLWLHRSVLEPSRAGHPTFLQIEASAAAFLCWSLGWAFACEGCGLFRPVAIPGGHAISNGWESRS